MGRHSYNRLLLTVAVILMTSCSENRGTRQQAAQPASLEQVVDSVLHCKMPIPRGMNSWKQGENFVWMSDNEVQTMRNVCLYAYDEVELDAAQFLQRRDSVMRRNIPGEEPGMYMRTAAVVTPTATYLKWNGRAFMRVAGLWEMEGDAMGGPFVSYCQVDSARRRVVVAEAFVYAPGRKKAAVMKRLEAQLLRLEITGK